MNFTYVFWIGVVSFILSSTLIALQRVDSLFYIQVIAGGMMFVGSKIGRSFLGLS